MIIHHAGLQHLHDYMGGGGVLWSDEGEKVIMHTALSTSRPRRGEAFPTGL